MKLYKLYLPLYEIFLAVIISVLIYRLPSNPHKALNTTEIFFIALFVILNSYSLVRIQKLFEVKDYLEFGNYAFKFFAIVSLFIAFGFGIIASNPSKLSGEESSEKTQVKINAAEVGLEKAQEVLTADLPKEEAKKQIEEQFSEQPEEKEIASIALNNTVTSLENTPIPVKEYIDQNKDQIIKKATESVEIFQYRWNCENVGCVYGEGQDIWNISTNDRRLGTFLAMVSLLLVVGIANTENIRRKLS